MCRSEAGGCAGYPASGCTTIEGMGEVCGGRGASWGAAVLVQLGSEVITRGCHPRWWGEIAVGGQWIEGGLRKGGGARIAGASETVAKPPT